jgi:carboxyl-terminal processing protease
MDHRLSCHRQPRWLCAALCVALAVVALVLPACRGLADEPTPSDVPPPTPVDIRPTPDVEPTAEAQIPTTAPALDLQTASADELKDAAYKTFRGGDFDQTDKLLKLAEAKAYDPELNRIDQSVDQFIQQRHEFTTDRKDSFNKYVSNVHKLQAANMPAYAMDWVREAYVVANKPDDFRHELWVDDLAQKAIQQASDAEKANDWLSAVRLYADLSAIEPGVAKWKDDLNEAAFRLRLLADYAPDLFKAKEDEASKERDKADALVNPTTQPGNKPATQPDDQDAFKTDWHDTLKGIQFSMLREALFDVHKYYYKDVSYKTLMVGGLQAIKALVTTPGLDQAFPDLDNAEKKNRFIAWIDQSLLSAQQAKPEEEERMLSNVLYDIQTNNNDTLELPEEVVVNEFAQGALNELDPYSSMIWPSGMDDFNKSTQGEFSGIGVQIELSDEGELKVVSPLEDSPAYKLGLEAGDVITRINGKSAKGITTSQAVRNITGPPGTNVNLTIRHPDGTSQDYNVRRDTIHVASLKGWRHEPGGGWDYFIDPQDKIAYLHLTNFTKSTADELDRATSELRDQGARAIILDLRWNPGGLLSAACAVSDKFLRSGVIVSTRPDRDVPGQDMPPVEAHDTPDDVDLPLVVLVNQISASASEIVAGALKDQHRATIIGERTWGKGSVQMLFSVDARAAFLKLTTSHYYLPSGRCIHREENSTVWGVEPDLKVDMTAKQMTDAIEARQDMDVLREANSPAATQPAVAAAAKPTTGPTTRQAKKDLLAVDSQLDAALLVLRLQLESQSQTAAAPAPAGPG